MSYSNHACVFVKYVPVIFPWSSLQHCEVAVKLHARSHLSFVLQFSLFRFIAALSTYKSVFSFGFLLSG